MIRLKNYSCHNINTFDDLTFMRTVLTAKKPVGMT